RGEGLVAVSRGMDGRPGPGDRIRGGGSMQIHEAWWLAALVLGIVEMLTGTFYLLVLALGCVAGGVVALAGGSLTLQLLATAACAIAGWALIWRRRRARARREEADL